MDRIEYTTEELVRKLEDWNEDVYKLNSRGNKIKEKKN